MELEEKCLQMIDEMTEETLKSDSFPQISKQTIQKIIGRDTLNAEEISIYRASIRWAEAECLRQNIQVK